MSSGLAGGAKFKRHLLSFIDSIAICKGGQCLGLWHLNLEPPRPSAWPGELLCYSSEIAKPS